MVSSALSVWQDPSTQASKPKTKSVSVTLHVKGIDTGKLRACIISYQFSIMHITYAVIETEK